MSEAEREWNLAQLDAEKIDRDVLGELIRCGARSIQASAGLKVDGLAGPATVDAIEEVLQRSKKAPQGHSAKRPQYQVPIPRKNAIESLYGSFSYKQNPKTPGAIIIDPKWVRENITGLTLHTGQKIWVHRLIAFELAELYEKACKVSGYTPRKIASWVPRHMRWDPKRSLSRHSWGIAFDIDWKENGVGMVDTPLHRHPEWCETFRAAGWNCGIYWGSRYNDPMHFERTAR